MTIESGLEIIFAINKVDLPTAQVEMCQNMMINQSGIKKEEIHLISAKSGIGIDKLLEDVIQKIPAPHLDNTNLRALVFDSYYDKYRGVICFVRIKNGSIKVNERIKFMQTGATYVVN